ncbi:Yip1 family protein [Limibacterium fermenti]|uniref:Yip1 family protein n=1 Tax=Limibacterium fermenti TaxID=3229863 RepID=UPI0026B18BC5
MSQKTRTGDVVQSDAPGNFVYYWEMRIFAFQNQKGMWRDIFLTIIQLTTSPQQAWNHIEKDEETRDEFFNRFLHPLFAIIAVTSFIGGIGLMHGAGLQMALKMAIINIVTLYSSYYIVSYTLNEMAVQFGLEKNRYLYQRFVGYSSVVMYALYMVMPLLSDFFILWVFALYTIYIVYNGAEIFMKTREEKRMNFSIVATLLIVAVPGLINAFMIYLIH